MFCESLFFGGVFLFMSITRFYYEYEHMYKSVDFKCESNFFYIIGWLLLSIILSDF